MKLNPPDQIGNVKFLSDNIQPIIWAAAFLSKFYRGEYNRETSNQLENGQKLVNLQKQLIKFFLAKDGKVDETYKLQANQIVFPMFERQNAKEIKHLGNILTLMEPLRKVINQNDNYLRQHHLL